MRIKGVSVSHPDKELFPGAHVSKGEIAGYYCRVAPRLLPYVGSRPLSFKVYPSGITGKGFFNKHVPDHFPEHVERINVPTKNGSAAMASADEEKDLIFFASQNIIEIHGALSTRRNLKFPDQLILDFDPEEGGFGKVIEIVRSLHRFLERSNIPCFLKVTGSKGMHVHIPLHQEKPFEEVKPLARKLAERIVEENPDTATLQHRKDKREGKVFIDYLRNEYGQTAVVPYSVRARPGAPVATPVAWNELSKGSFKPDGWGVQNLFRRLGHQKSDPWSRFNQSRIDFSTLQECLND